MLSPKQQRFVTEYVVDLNATQAAIRAGYSAKTAYSLGGRLLKKAEVQALISERQSKSNQDAGLRAEHVMTAIAHVVQGDIRTLFDAKGNLRPIKDLSLSEAALIAGFEVIKKNAEAGDGHIDTVHKVKLKDTARFVEMAAKHFALLVEVVRHEGLDGMELKIQQRRALLANQPKLLPAKT